MRQIADIHTHYIPQKADGKAIINLSVAIDIPLFELLSKAIPPLPISIGLHPWHVIPHWERHYGKTLEHIASINKQIIAIGEAGLDRIKGGEWNHQLAAFQAQAILAEETNKPLIIHCVKAFDEIIRIHKEMHPHQKWIIHGFRGKAIQVQQLVNQGFYLSFGEYYHEEALRACPPEFLFLETDESKTNISTLYTHAARIKNITSEELYKLIQNNIVEVFMKKR